MSKRSLRSRHRFAILVGVTAFGLSGSAQPDSSLPTPERTPSVSIDSTGVKPSRLLLTTDQHLVFYNDSESVARVEIELEHGIGIDCVGAGGAVLHGRKFVIPSGTVLDCERPPTNVAYRVFRSGSGSVARSEGRIEIDHGSDR